MHTIQGFLHIGLGKCASSYLQTVWDRDAGHHSFNFLKVANVVRELVEKRENRPLSFNLPVSPGTTRVATCEGLTWGWINQSTRHDLIPELHRMGASLLGRAGAPRTVLLMVRDPIDWIRAAHEQSVKEGGVDARSAFLVSHDRFIRHVLNLESLGAAYEASGFRIVILSADELRADPDAFWARYEARLDAPIPNAAIRTEVGADSMLSNTGFGALAPALADMNRLFDALFHFFETQGSAAQQAQSVRLRPIMRPFGAAMLRRLSGADANALRAQIRALAAETSSVEWAQACTAALETMMSACEASGDPRDVAFVDALRNAFGLVGPTALSVRGAEALEAVQARLPEAGPPDDEAFFEGAPAPDLRDHLKARFLAPLRAKADIPSDILDRYAAALDGA